MGYKDTMNQSDVNFDSLLKGLSVGLVVHNQTSEIVYANAAALNLLRLSLDQAQGKSVYDPHWQFLDEQNKPLPTEHFPVQQVINTLKSVYNQVIGIQDSSTPDITWVLVNASPEFDSAGQISFVTIVFTDITAQKQDIPFESILTQTNDMVIVTETNDFEYPNPKIVYVNQAVIDMTGYSRDEIIGNSPRIFQGEQTSKVCTGKIREALEHQKPLKCELLNYKKNGEPYWIDFNIQPLKNALGEVVYYAAIERDITQQKLEMNKLESQANKDFLTQLHNRRSFMMIAEQILQQQKRDHSPLAIAMLDVDFFKSVNDTHGHAVGDEVLINLASQMKKFFRGSDVVARVGGEEFTILLKDNDLTVALAVVEKFGQQIAKTSITALTGEIISISVSIGLAQITPIDTLQTAIEKADRALYSAKNAGRNQTVVYDPKD